MTVLECLPITFAHSVYPCFNFNFPIYGDGECRYDAGDVAVVHKLSPPFYCCGSPEQMINVEVLRFTSRKFLDHE